MMIDEAFCLFPPTVRDRLMNVCLLHPLFCDLYEALYDTQEQTGLTPEEVWSEASGVALRLGQSPRPDFLIKHDYNGLLGRYRTFVAHGNTEHRDDHQADATRCAVFTTLLYMLASASPTESNPHAKLCVFIVKRLMEHPLYQDLCRDIRRSENQEEADGHFVPPTDYTQHTENTLPLMEEGELVHIDELVQEAVGTHSTEICRSVLHVLMGYNVKHGHKIQRHIDHLCETMNRLMKEQNTPRTIENNGTINHIENNQGPVNGDVKEQRFLMGNGMNGKQIEAEYR